MKFASINNLTLHYQEIGAPEGSPVLVFINSLGADFRIWRDVIVRFVGEAHIVTYDKRGHGLSDVGSAPYSVEDHASDLAALLDHIGKKDVILIGLSVGGLIAQALYKARPDLVRAMVLSDTASKIGTSEFWADRINSIEIGGMDSLADATMARWFTKEYHEKEPLSVVGYRNMVARQPLEGYTGTCAALRDADLRADAAVIAVPTMCVVGLEDTVTTPEHVYEMADLIPNSRYEEIAHAAHLPCIDQADPFARLLKDFIRSLNQADTEGASIH